MTKAEPEPWEDIVRLQEHKFNEELKFSAIEFFITRLKTQIKQEGRSR